MYVENIEKNSSTIISVGLGSSAVSIYQSLDTLRFPENYILCLRRKRPGSLTVATWPLTVFQFQTPNVVLVTLVPKGDKRRSKILVRQSEKIITHVDERPCAALFADFVDQYFRLPVEALNGG